MLPNVALARSYLPTPDRRNALGRNVAQQGYITDELTEYALDWIGSRGPGKPWMTHLVHKAVHAEPISVERHKGRYVEATPRYPDSMAPGVSGRPMWAAQQLARMPACGCGCATAEARRTRASRLSFEPPMTR
ncbi:hypothetical protein V5740_13410 [Croceibacterium sp. TMG7-5b_MA50]|uniref:hypothetical protein n=1 Tax=Croceibacterium sp. TMG7-5b_MA50 TaxID=3121290 RepID=UPI0032214593